MNSRLGRGEVEISALDRADREDAIALLTRAFIDDPLMAFIMEDLIAEGRVENGLTALMDYSLAIREQLEWPILGLREGEVVSGVAALSLPVEGSWPEALVQQFEGVKDILGLQASERLKRYGEIAEGARPEAIHIFLGVLGIDPSAQGQGYGKKLLDAIQDISESYPGSIGVFLDTDKPSNVRFYEHCGFEVMSHHKLDHVDIWCLYRPNDKSV